MVLRLGRNLLKRQVISEFNPPHGCLARQKDIELVASLVELTSGKCCDHNVIEALYKIMIEPYRVSESCLLQIITGLSKLAEDC